MKLLQESVPELQWLANPLDHWGSVPTPPTVEIRAGDIERGLGIELDHDDVIANLEGLGFNVEDRETSLLVRAPSSRLDIRSGAAGRADVIEEIARLHGYRRLPRRTPTWPQPGGLTDRQRLRRQIRDVIVDLGVYEAWTPTLGSDADFDLLHPGGERVRVTNPLASDEAVLRATLLTGLVRAWGRNAERGTGDVLLGEMGAVFIHPDITNEPHATRGGEGGALILRLPRENERLTLLLGRDGDDATTAVALWSVLAERLGLADVVVRTNEQPPPGLHPTRSAQLVDRQSGVSLGDVGEVDAEFVGALAPSVVPRRLGVVDVDLDALADASKASRRSDFVNVPSRYPSAVIDLAFVVSSTVNAADLAEALRHATPLVESITLFDVYRDVALPANSRSLAYNVRLNSTERTLKDSEVSVAREQLISVAASLGATLR